MIFIDDSNYRIHAFASKKYCEDLLEKMKEGEIYILSNFKDKTIGLEIEEYAFDLYYMEEIEKIADDNRFLIEKSTLQDDSPEEDVSIPKLTVKQIRQIKADFNKDMDKEETNNETPQTGNSTNMKSRSRKNVEPVEYDVNENKDIKTSKKKRSGLSGTGEEQQEQEKIFKAFNILLIDNMKNRIHAFIPGLCVDNLESKLDVDAEVEEMEDESPIIPFEMFDFNDHSELKSLAEQKTYLTDVVGIIKKFECRDLKNSKGNNQTQGKLIITDGSSQVNVIFWDQFAVNLKACLNQGVEKPVIIIISSAKVGLWNEEVDISNVSATRFYLNYKHHNVAQLRRKLNEPDFAKKALTQEKKKGMDLLTVDQITKLGKDYIDSQVLAHVMIKSIADTSDWFIRVCTTCDNETEWINGLFVCQKCPRTVPHPDKRYKLNVVASDSTGGLEIILGDREVRTLIGKRARDLYDESLPADLQQIRKTDYTVVLQIRDINVVHHFQV
ncbi:hypothetical protein POM88_021003 [Heracleum sosnowskyi]|uniref:Replication factor A C-terminal domain-containing protein n=1 Tax=Heracleum sosnowskyi TaxID=360622 RepID=A0AAD8MTE2_9APIA|nr:hypothetical protein POM88_021003 [Heracleum sosnowskyi]